MSSSLHPLVLKAREALARGDFRSAEHAAEERLKTAGRDINALQVRCTAQQRRGQFGEAARTLQTVIGIDSRAHWAYGELIQLLLAHGKLTDAEQVARAAVRANPDNADSHNAFGLILSQMNELPSGEWHYRRALDLAEPAGDTEAAGNTRASYFSNLALNLMRQGRVDEAEGYFAKAHELTPEDAQTLMHWSTLHQARGRFPRAEELLDRAEAVTSPADTELLRARYLAREGRDEEALSLLDSARTVTAEVLLTRGRLRERVGQYPQAWQDFVAGKRKLASEGGELQYKADAVEALFARFKQYFTRENIERAPKAPARKDVPQPVFIIGFPRSGATLIEQLLSVHPAIKAGGELPFAGELRKLSTDQLPGGQPFPENLGQSWTADRQYVASLFRDYYLARAERFGLADSGKPLFTDRMPFNELQLPLLKMAFPQARIIQVIRHPLDLCVSVMSNPVAQGFNCGYRLEDVAHHLNAVADLVEHYCRELGSDHYLLRYESLVADPVAETRKMLSYLGLPVGEVQAAPQVNDHSVGRYRHFEAQLQPCASRLQKLIAAQGYASA